MSKPATIKDIARELNLSTSTVSRALNDRWDINRETRDKVLEAAKKLNYKPNLMSLGLKRSQTYTIGVIIPEFVNSFFAEVINGINSVLQNQNYQLLICQSNESWEAEQNNIRFLGNVVKLWDILDDQLIAYIIAHAELGKGLHIC